MSYYSMLLIFIRIALLKWLSESDHSVVEKCAMESHEEPASRLKKEVTDSRSELMNSDLTKCLTLKVNKKTYIASALTTRSWDVSKVTTPPS